MAKRQSTLKPIPTDLFSFRSNTFVAEASDLREYEFNSVITLKNPKTGGQVKFDLVAVDRDPEEEVTAWRFKGAAPKHAHLEITVFND